MGSFVNISKSDKLILAVKGKIDPILVGDRPTMVPVFERTYFPCMGGGI